MATATKTRRRGGPGKPWNKTELKLAQGRLPVREVARRTGRTEAAVSFKRWELNSSGQRKSRRGKVQPSLVNQAANAAVESFGGSVETFDHNGTVQDAVLQELREEVTQVEDDIAIVTEELEQLQGREDELIKKIADIENGTVNVEVRFVR